MPTGRLTVARASRLTAPGRYADGGCLYLVVTPTGARQWVARLTIHGRQTDLGLGGLSYVTLAEAREEAARLRKVARQGGDPRVERRREALTFEAAARRVHEGLAPTWRNPKHAREWLSSLERYAFPRLGARPLDTIGTADALAVLAPIWTKRPETARRVKQRLGAIFDWAKSAGHYPRENPVTGLKKGLPTVKAAPEHMAALPWRELPGFMEALASREGVSARTLALLILTATRSGEARGMRWAELDGAVWTVPPERMKRGLAHRVPLSPEALGVVERMRGRGAELVFPGPTRGPGGAERPQSENVFRALFARMGREGMTAHGFRSTFRDWCSEAAHAPRDLAEAALAHATGDATERAYARSDLFERRRELMIAWGRFAMGGSAGA